MKNLIKDSALNLIRKNGTTTTLEVKNDLIANQSKYFWKQRDVSQAMRELEADGELIIYADNGVYRTYSTLGFLSNPAIEKVSLTQLAKLVQDNAGNSITLAHTKKTTGDINVMQCVPVGGMNALGAILLIEDGQVKTVYPASILEVRVGNTIYQLKK